MFRPIEAGYVTPNTAVILYTPPEDPITFIARYKVERAAFKSIHRLKEGEGYGQGREMLSMNTTHFISAEQRQTDKILSIDSPFDDTTQSESALTFFKMNRSFSSKSEPSYRIESQ